MTSYIFPFGFLAVLLFHFIVICTLLGELLSDNVKWHRVRVLFIFVKFQTVIFMVLGTLLPYFGLIESWFDVSDNNGYLMSIVGWASFSMIVKGSTFLSRNKACT
ncbi:hypothetical protein DMJ27_25375 [Vibrio parahaemolyticus]|nr:hypothetical protein [Vibrio parahaemolyticus]